MKKRLFPALLALVLALTMLSVGVFAAADPSGTSSGGGSGSGGTTTTTPAGTKDDPFLITGSTVADTVEVDSNGGFLLKKDGYYKLTQDITPYIMLLYGASSATIDLNGYNITHKESSPQAVIQVSSGNLTITNSDTTKSSTITSVAASAPIIAVMGTSGSTTTVENVTLQNTNNSRDNSGCAIGFVNYQDQSGNNVLTKNAKVTLKNCTIKDYNGISVNGLVDEGNTIDLDNVNITPNAAGSGLYLAGPATTTVKGGTIEGGNLGIEIRAGVLNVQDGAVIKGGNGEPTSTGNGSGSTTTNAGIAVAQHTTVKPITVNIADSAQVSGGSALYVANPQENTATNIDQTVTVSGTGTTLTSTYEDNGAKGDAVFAQAPVDIVIKEGAKLDGNVTMKKDDKNANKGGVDITGATVNGSITNQSGDGAAVTVRQSTVTGTITDVGIVSGCTDSTGTPIENVVNSNTSLKVEKSTDTVAGFPLMKITGMKDDCLYLIRVSTVRNNEKDEKSVLLLVKGSDVTNHTYSFNAKVGTFITVREYNASVATGTIEGADILTQRTDVAVQ